MSDEPRTVVVSYRLPLTLRRVGPGWRGERSTGGLATALGPVVRGGRGLWVGAAGDAAAATDPERDALLAQWERQGFVAVDIPPAIHAGFYDGFANGALWPLFHHFPTRFQTRPGDWEAYVAANRRFCDAVLERLQPGDRVWVHDYQLMLLPAMLREARPDLAIGFFLHIPFPASEVFRVLPHREELLRGLLAADLVGFQTWGHAQHFRWALLRLLGIDSGLDRVEREGRVTRIEAFPIGIAPEEFTRTLATPRAQARLAELRARDGRRLVLAVDRLDYTKGIPERLRAFRLLLERHPEWRGRVCLVQVAVPSRERVSRYRELRREVSELVGEINGELGTPEWTPVVYLKRAVAREELVALYAAADVCWVAPLRDGMNLVAKEYVACQEAGAGVLLLSELAGAAAEMGEALHVNPYDAEGSAATLVRALTLPAPERQERLAALRVRVHHSTAHTWAARFLGRLGAAAAERVLHGGPTVRPLPLPDLASAWNRAERRLLLLDYDGTLTPLRPRPSEAAPDADLVALLSALCAEPRNTVAVVSGRPAAVLDPWLGAVPGLHLVAEHGATRRLPGAPWQPLRPGANPEWKAHVRPLLDAFTLRAPGSFVEEKPHALAWHYRLTEPQFGEWLARDLLATLEGVLAATEVRAVPGNKVVEVRFAWAHKGEAARTLLAESAAELALAVGDDQTDEDLFAALRAEDWSVVVGRQASRARFQLPTPAAVRAALQALVSA
ncbi:MAG: bifunctional alpha,alpha-trehalose-phosphate synthase (UDP-forming)/trehalose-phosphatase [Vicinamibacteria bacterium]|nr:bifunctional alpha,alpha-trehalose-phosphate synthase (UDP-forming)/trehalose-phosphatase [Vicinamibacteria bacterium]